ncbi:NUDIX hydrolase [Streptomyces ipomoeae]|jgi:8-oxo-dGTP pyrophosphatase MutT (NUDIX family)|uniref:NUDIX hydrolase n=1 Tax=Streptomyces ipomoeae TaxID=103232 RepID=UPI0029A2622C|nr:NUDIX hydrolase [Streptomyces ipomoeae]MDX2819927.1 NUDIX hydrolase [Streptomyces ipomoeae]MDX2872627.1 NUDIX hydrolase [Streptomyces ipomoeae]
MSTPRPLNASAAALFFDDDGNALIVNPTYKDHWNLPGGGIEIHLGETPYDAAVREVREELGITPPIGRLLVTAWLALGSKGAQVLYVFDGGVLSAEDQAAITLQESELSEYRFCSPHNLEPGLIPPHLTEVWQAALTAHSERRTEYVSVRL